MFVLLGLLTSSLIYIGYSIFMAFICLAIAVAKDRDYVGWFLLGLIFGIFALIILAILPVRVRHKRQPGMGRIKVEAPVMCPFCDYQNSRAWHYCKHCGASLT